MHRAAHACVATLVFAASAQANLIPNPGFETGFVGDPFNAGVGLGDIPDPWTPLANNNHPSTSSPDTHANNGVGGIPVTQTFSSFGNEPFFSNTAIEGNRFVGAVERPDLFEPFGVELPQRLSPVRDYTFSAQLIASDSIVSGTFNTSFEGGYEVLLSEDGTLNNAESVAFLPFTGNAFDEWAPVSVEFTSPFRSLQYGTLILAPRYTGNSPASRQVHFGIDDLHLDLTPIPEPTTAALLGLTALSLTRRTK
ncbi:hypothetical protein [Mucisphaera sp.]|uniref:hypothetical protein n=1 Tax=Mucisphaera sp. TaxID=2913024 RepID=UPI003D0F5AE7